MNIVIVDFHVRVKTDYISLPDIAANSAKRHNRFRSSDSYLIINVHCSGESASQIGEFINTTNCSRCPFPVMVGSLYGFLWAGWYTTLVCTDCGVIHVVVTYL